MGGIKDYAEKRAGKNAVKKALLVQFSGFKIFNIPEGQMPEEFMRHIGENGTLQVRIEPNWLKIIDVTSA